MATVAALVYATPTVETATGLRWISLACGGLSGGLTGSAMGLSLFFSFLFSFVFACCFAPFGFFCWVPFFFSSYDFSLNINSSVLEAQNRTCGKITL